MGLLLPPNHLILSGNDTYVDNQFNLWQGKFPKQNTKEDGYIGILGDHIQLHLSQGVSPVKSYNPNSYGVFNLLGNTWEWVSGGTPEKVK
jgi:sulfatase modifying factor 1